MSTTTKTLLIIFAVLILLIGMSYCTGRKLGKMAGGPGAAVITDDSWLRVNPSAYLADYNEIMPMQFLGDSAANSTQSICAKIRHSANDKRIKGIILEPGMLQISLPALNEIGIAIADFKVSGKPVYAYGDYLSQGDYLLASYADEIFMEPSASAGLMLTGTSANSLFYKDMYDKLGIKMHVIQAGEFKGAGEPYSQTSFSEGTRQNIAAALSDRFESILKLIATNRKITVDDVRTVYNNREELFIPAEQAVSMKLIDHAMSRAEMLKKLETDSEKMVPIAKYAAGPEFSAKEKIAVVYLNGNISAGPASYNQSMISHAKVQKICKALVKDKSIKAVVLRINSPGGSALESELIYQELLRLKASKPIVVSMGSVAASGGYYISCAADKILADEGTITGSIGVIMVLPEGTGLGRKIGINSQTIKFGKFAGGINPLEPYSPELLASLKQSSIATYDEFKSRVMTARKISPDKIQSIAEGRIYSAEDALGVGLIDSLGNLEDAVLQAAEMANISDYAVTNYPLKITFFEALKDSEFFRMSLKSLLENRILDIQKLAERYVEPIEPGTWQYLMPTMVD
ncbi:MAG: signal peptide peptidase SppA [Candidatus Cloacimonetes bacterium]|nr:signal peptide peptidase SppA [Candidatus Cloacimonadota bacterium]